MADMRVKLAGVDLKNPITVASGTFGFGREYGEFLISPVWGASPSRA